MISLICSCLYITQTFETSTTLLLAFITSSDFQISREPLKANKPSRHLPAQS